MSKIGHKEQESPQNSVLREKITKPATELVKLIHTYLPWLTPNEITVLGTTGVAGLVLYASKLEKEGKIDFETSLKLVGLFISLSATDALDGSLARYKRSQGEISHDSSIGQLVDSISDRLQEAFSSWLAMYRAAENNDKLWLVTATLTAFTNPLSSLVRAWAEANNVVVPESGRDPLELLGTRAGRFGTATMRFAPHMKVGSSSVQAGLDLLTATATTKTTIGRLVAIKEGKQNTTDQKLATDAQRRFKLLGGLALITGTTTALLLHTLLKKRTRI